MPSLPWSSASGKCTYTTTANLYQFALIHIKIPGALEFRCDFFGIRVDQSPVLIFQPLRVHFLDVFKDGLIVVFACVHA